MIDTLIEINKNIIIEKQDDKYLIKKHRVIKEILESKDAFNLVPIEIAYSILRDLKIKEEKLEDVYLTLI